MSSPKHILSIVGREAIIDGLISRLLHPDDLRDSPATFISPGFYGLAGAGKSRILHEIELLGKEITPYVAKVDFDSRASVSTPSTPVALLRHVIDILEQQERTTRPLWRRLFWKWSNPFLGCREMIERSVTTINQNVILTSSQVGDLSQGIELGSTIPEGLNQTFTTAIMNLHARKLIKRIHGDIGVTKRLPLILVILDTIELAPRPIRQWLPQIHSVAGGRNTLLFHLMFVIAGRYQLSGVVETELPPFDLNESKLFVEEYAAHELTQSSGGHRKLGLERLLDSEKAKTALAEQGQGIPLLLQLLVKTVALDAQASLQFDDLPEQHHVRVHFVIENYLERLRNQAGLEQDERTWLHYHLMLYTAVPRLIPNASLLRALLSDLPGTNFGATTNYEGLFEELAQEGFIGRTSEKALIFHSLIREGISSYLGTNDAERFNLLHQRAAKWFRDHNSLSEYFYHGLIWDRQNVFEELKSALEQFLKSLQWLEVQSLIEVTTDIPLSNVERSWITIYKADLAWGENNPALALERLRQLYPETEQPEVGEGIASRLESWLGFSPSLEKKIQDQNLPDMPAEYVPDLRWWSEKRNLPWSTTFALLTLGKLACAAKHFEQSRDLLERCLAIAEKIRAPSLAAESAQMLGEVALILGPLAKAEKTLKKAAKLYAAQGDEQSRWRIHAMTGISLFHQGKVAKAREMVEQSRSAQGEMHDEVGEAISLKLLSQMEGAWSSEGTDTETALRLLKESLEKFKAAGYGQGKAQVLSLIGESLLYFYPEKENFSPWHNLTSKHFQEAEEGYRRAEDRLGEGFCAAASGMLQAMDRQNETSFDLAIVKFRQARGLYRAENDLLSKAHMLTTLGAVLYTMWKKQSKLLAESHQSLNEALDIYTKLNDPLGQAGVLFIQGQMELWNLSYEPAQKYFEQVELLLANLPGAEIQHVRNKNQLLLERVLQHAGPPDKRQEHIVFMFRLRVPDLYGWSSISRREFLGVYTLFERERPSQAYQGYFVDYSEE